jgi:hypothetical protein
MHFERGEACPGSGDVVAQARRRGLRLDEQLVRAVMQRW